MGRAARGTRRAATVTAVAVALALPAAALAGCSFDEADPGREAAVEDVLARYPGQIDRGQAECWVDRVSDELGAELLAADATPTDAQVRRMTAIRVDCIGVADLGRSGTAVPSPSTSSAVPVDDDGPWTLGDDPALDELWAGCEAGDGPSCDALFEAAPLGSDYEAFGLSCGGRGTEPRCADVYPALPGRSSATSAPGPSPAPG